MKPIFRRTSLWAWCHAAVACLACSGAVGSKDEPGDGANDESADLGVDDSTPSSDPASTGDTPSSDSPADTAPSEGDSPASPSTSPSTPSPDDESPANDPDAEPGTQVLPASATVSPRLSQAELNNALRDLLGDGSAPASLYLSEDEFSPYDNDATRQTVSSALIDSMQVLAEDVALRMAHDADTRSAWMPCEPGSVRDEACFDTTVLALSRAFFRRNVLADEVAPYRVLLDYAEEQEDFYVAIELLLSSLIQDPEFLYRLERGTGSTGVLQLDDHEIAARMSFLLWGSAPDAALLDEADGGALADNEGRRAAAERLLADGRARRQLNRFHSMWLGYRAIPHDAELNASFQLETESLIERVVFDEPQNYLQLFQSDETYLTVALAEHYGLPSPDGEGWVTYPDGSGRAGILSHGSVLSAFSKFSDTSPTQRGIFVRTRLMCLQVPPPPPTVDVDQPPGGEEAEGECKLDRYRAHREQSGCVDCHMLFDPIGEGLENYDMAGRYRTHDDDNENCEFDAAGSLVDYGEFRGPAELAALLVDNDLIQECFVKQYLQYSLNKGALTASEQELAVTLTQNFEADGLRLDEFLLEFVSQERFAQKQEEAP